MELATAQPHLAPQVTSHLLLIPLLKPRLSCVTSQISKASEQWFSKRGPRTSCISFTRELVKHANSWTYSSRNSRGGTQQSVFEQVLQVILMHMAVEDHCLGEPVPGTPPRVRELLCLHTIAILALLQRPSTFHLPLFTASSTIPLGKRGIVLPILQTRKLGLTQGHTANRRQNQGSKPGLLIPRPGLPPGHLGFSAAP